MNVLHISTLDRGGAGLCAYRMVKSQQKLGINARMLVLESNHREDKNISSPYHYYSVCYRAFHKILRKLHIYCFDFDKLARQSEVHHGAYTSPVRNIDISEHPWIKEADVIHLHWIDNFFHQPLFFSKVKKPIVWTIHDEGFFYGTSHYHDNILNDDCLEQKYRIIKLKMVKDANNLQIVLLSKYFKRHFSNNDILKDKPIHVINNSVDCSSFTMYDKKKSREILGLDNDIIYFIFLAADIADVHKGLNNLIKAIESFNSNVFRIIAIGGNQNFFKNKYVLDTGKIYDHELLSKYMSAADYFVMPSLQEAFSQAPIEAMACGKPVIVTPVSGTEELVTPYNGIICNGFESKDIAQGINEIMDRKFDPQIIRQDVIDRFSPEKIAQQYIKLYNEILA